MVDSQKHKFWQGHINAWQCSGLSQAAYCRRHRLPPANFRYWRKRCRTSAAQTPEIIPVVREGDLDGIRLRSPSGWQLLLPPRLDMATLRMIMAALP